MNRYIQNLPKDLMFDGMFCAWNEKKIPINIMTGQPADSSKSETFTPFMIAKNYIDKYYKYDESQQKQVGGIGLGCFNGLSAIDLDNCVENGVPNEFAMEIIDFVKSYCEFSPSGKGIHIYYKNDGYYDKNRYYLKNTHPHMEVYVSGVTSRYVTLTGNKYKYDEIRRVDLTKILEKYMVRSTKLNTSGDDFSRALINDKKLYELWNAQAPGSGSNESELDQALLCKIAFYTKCDPIKTRVLFENSPYFNSKDEMHKNKWNDGYHAEYSLNRAIDFTRNNVIANVMNSAPNQVIDKETGEIKNVNKFDLKGTDISNAELFINAYKDKLRYNTDLKDKGWMIWNGRYWQVDVNGEVRTYANKIAQLVFQQACDEEDEDMRKIGIKNAKYLLSSRGIDNMLKEARSYVACQFSDFDKNPYILCCKNKIIDMRSGEEVTPRQEDMIMTCTGNDIDMDHEPTLFIKTLKEIFGGDEELLHYVQKAFGYSFTGITREQCMFILRGDGNDGKSLLLSTLENCAGGYAASAKPTLLMENKWGISMAHPEEIARLNGKRFIVVQEPKMTSVFDESVLKSLCSGLDKMTARFMYCNTFEFYFTGKMWLATNYDPIIRGTDRGIWRRQRKINVHADFTGREDKDLTYKLKVEYPQILGWLVKGFLMYQEEGLKDTAQMQETLKEYKNDMDVTERWASAECEFNDMYYSYAEALYESCKRYCKQYENYDITMTMFGRLMSKKYKKDRINGGKTIYRGLRIRIKSLEEREQERKEIYGDINLDLEDI